MMARRGFLGWLIGIATGTALGVLFAPRKGKETRERIKKARKQGGVGYEPVFEDIKKLGAEISGAASGIYKGSVLQDQIEEWRSRLKDLSEDFVSDAADFHRENVKPVEREGKRLFRGGKRVLKDAVRGIKAVVKPKKFKK